MNQQGRLDRFAQGPLQPRITCFTLFLRLCHDGMPQLRVEATAVLLRELHQGPVRRVMLLLITSLTHQHQSAQSLRDFRLQIQHAAVDRDDQVRKAAAAIDTITDSRIRRADLSTGQERLDELNEGLASLRRENDRGLQAFLSPPPTFWALKRRS
jgi:hypothetical protein